MVSDHIRKTLALKSATHTKHLDNLTPANPMPLPSTVHVLPTTPQTRAMHTSLLLPNLSAEDFIFTTNRICTLLIEHAVSLAPYPPKTVTTPQGVKYRGRAINGPNTIAAAVLLRGGSVLETALHRVLPAAPVARLLIQSNYRTGEPELHYTSPFPMAFKTKEDGRQVYIRDVA
jgi:uridine kinase